MIVRNESHIIERLLTSAMPLVDTYCICDTGSTDDTVDIIRRVMTHAGKPGIIITEPFRDFGYNRTVALQAAAAWGEFALLLDADMCLTGGPIASVTKALLTPDLGAVLVRQKNGNIEYSNVRIVNLHIGVTCVGPTHEYYDIPAGYRQEHTDALQITDIGDGGCKADKFARDIRLLTTALAADPNNPRYNYYLANSYRDSGQYGAAVPHYRHRIDLGGWREEVFDSCMQLGDCYERLGDTAAMIYWWLEAYNRHNGRAESLYRAVKHYRTVGAHRLADVLCQQALAIPYPANDALFIQPDVYTYGLHYEASILAYYTGRPLDHRRYLELIGAGRHAANLISNYKFYSRKLSEIDDALIHDFSDSEGTHTSSTPCIIPYMDGYLMNVRYVNYQINAATGSYHFSKESDPHDKTISTINKAVWLDRQLLPLRSHWFETLPDHRLKYRGIEDVRLFESNGALCFSGTVQEPISGHLRVGYGQYDPTADSLHAELLPSPFQRPCEKNWAFFGDLAVYEWSPLRSINASGTIVAEEAAVPGFFRHLLGSSAGVRVLSTPADELWFLTHFVEHSTPRHYYHMLVVLDAQTLTVQRWSTPFKFRGEPIEYGLGLIVEPTRVLFSFSCWDRTTNVLAVPRRAIEALFTPA